MGSIGDDGDNSESNYRRLCKQVTMAEFLRARPNKVFTRRKLLDACGFHRLVHPHRIQLVFFGLEKSHIFADINMTIASGLNIYWAR